MAKKYRDDKITVTERDLDKIRVRPQQFISSIERGRLHIITEMILNNKDECCKDYSPGNSITIEMTDDWISSRDNGRGIPTDKLRVIHESIQAGSNMTRDNGMTTGENGCGTATYTALSKDIIITTFRPQEKKKLTLHYKEGILVDEIMEDYNGKESGMYTKFTPSAKVLGSSKIPIEDVKVWLSNFDYTLPSNVNMKYTINGETTIVKHKPLYEYFDIEIPDNDRLCEPVVFNIKGDLKETILGNSYDRSFIIEAAVVYTSSMYKGIEVKHSWMNDVNTINNGMHVNGVINGLTKYLTEKCISKRKSLADEDWKKDVLSNLHIVVKGKSDIANMFSEQAKLTVCSRQLSNAIAKALYDDLISSPSRVDELVDIVIANNRVRREGEKVRNINSSLKTPKDWTRIESLLPCSSAKTSREKELFIVEGKSASGGIRAARDASYQAIIMVRGKSLNIWDVELARILKSQTWLNLIKALKCGIGPTFDIKKSAYGKIIITTDADIDGFHIRTILLSFFLKYAREYIDQGMVYIAEPPLYKLVQGKNVSYVATNIEYIDACINSVSDFEIEFK